MRELFAYNWTVRRDWLDWCGGVPAADLLRQRTGGQGGILRNLFHAVDVEYSWLRTIHGLAEFEEPFERHGSLAAVAALDARFRPEVEAMLASALPDLDRMVPLDRHPGEAYSVGDILRHTLVHEVHHAGQLAVWARELGLRPVSADFLHRVH